MKLKNFLSYKDYMIIDFLCTARFAVVFFFVEKNVTFSLAMQCIKKCKNYILG